MSLDHLKISTRLALGFGLLVLLTAAMGLFGWHQTRVTDATIASLYADRVVPLMQLDAVATAYVQDIEGSANKVAQGLLGPRAATARVDEASRPCATLLAEPSMSCT